MIPAPQLCNITRGRVEVLFQYNYTGEEVPDLVSNGGSSLKIRLSKGDLNRELWTYVLVSASCGDSPQDGFEGTKLFRGLLIARHLI